MKIDGLFVLLNEILFRPHHLKMKVPIIISLLLSLFLSNSVCAQIEKGYLQKDFTQLVHFVASKTDSNHFESCDHHQWEAYLNRPHANVETLNSYFEAAAQEFEVPVLLLKVIGQIESNWTQIGPSIDQGWGIMHLVDNSYAHTLIEAAQLLKLEPQVLKESAQENIRGMATLLRHYQKEELEESVRLEDWFHALKATTGLYSDDLAEAQVYRYFESLNSGIESNTLWGEKIIIEPQNLDISANLNKENSYLFPNQKTRSLDYPPAISNLTPCNHAEGRNHEIDAWVNHWIGVGTYAGAISWFHNCDAEVSSHFVIRSSDGEITQVVAIANTAWHCGASGYPYNNSRSIGVEHEATLSNPELWNSMPMLEASAEMAAFFCDEYGIPKIKALPGINGHNDMPGTNTLCPGNLPWFTWMTLLDENYSEADLVIMDMWTTPEVPEVSFYSHLWVEIRNVGNADADSIYLDFRIDNEIIGFDSLIHLEAGESHIFTHEDYLFYPYGQHDYCVYIEAVSNESNTMNNSYCIDVEVDPLFSVEDQESAIKLQVYPNPSMGIFHYETENHSISSIEVYNLQGFLVQKIQNLESHKIDLSPLSRGAYLLKFMDKEGNFIIKRVIKQ